LEVVDYVIIDENPTPLENIKSLQPDYFAKGYEYVRNGLHPKTQEEREVVQNYGGEIIFTPGDVVFSSSAFLEMAPPSISVEKLLTLMEAEAVTFDALRAALDAFTDVQVHVVGDTIVDSYIYCSLIGSTAKTPTFSVKYDHEVDFVGGAGIVAKHVRKAGAAVRFSTVLGSDTLKEFVLKDVRGHGIECDAVVDRTRPTTQKTVFIAGDYRMLKVDKLDNRPISDRILQQLQESLSSNRADAIVFSDFRHGVFSRSTTPELTKTVPTGVFRAADSQVASRWGNILDFKGFDLITPNEREARFALGDQDSVIRPLALELYLRAQCKTLILKVGERGIITYRAASDDSRSFFTVDSFVDNLVDPVGAGDALLAYSTLALVTTGSPVVASILGGMAAAVACEHDGNNPVDPADVVRKLETVEKRAHYL
jgi:rfaE bifunctional protein kinase chain/domain